MPIGFKVTATVKGVPFDGLVWIDFAGYSGSEKISIANGGTFEIESPRNGVFKIASQENVDANYMSVKVSTSIVKSDFYFKSKDGFDPAVLSDYVTTDDLDATLSDYAKIDEAAAEAKKAAKNAGGSSNAMLIADSLSGLICQKINEHGDITPSNDFVSATAQAPNGPAWQLPSVERRLVTIDFQNVDTTTWQTLTDAEAVAGVKTVRSVPKHLYIDVETGFNFNTDFKLWDIADVTSLPDLFDSRIVEKRAFPAIHDGVQVADGAYVFDGYLAQLPYKPAENKTTLSFSYVKISDVKGFFSTAFKFWSDSTEGLDTMSIVELELENVDTICFDTYVQPNTLTIKGDFSAIDVAAFRGIDSVKIEGRSLLTASTALFSTGFKSKFTTFEMLDVTSIEFADWLIDTYEKNVPGETLDKSSSESYVYAFDELFNWNTTVEYTEIKLKDVTLHGNPTTTGFWSQQWPTATFEDADGNMKSFHVSAANNWQSINNDPFIPTAVKATFRQNLDSTAVIPFKRNALGNAANLKSATFYDFSLTGKMVPPLMSFLGIPSANTINELTIGKNSVFTIAGNAIQSQLIGSTKHLDVLVLEDLGLATKMPWCYTDGYPEWCHKLEIGNSVDANGKQTTVADIKSAFMDSNVAMDGGAKLYPRIGWQPAESGDCEVWFNGLHVFTFGDGYSETVDDVTTYKWVCKWEKFPVA